MLRVEGLKLSLANGRVITKVDSLEVVPGSRWLIKGGSGAGKTTFLKALAGIWQYGEGVITVPEGRMMFLPQEPYLPLGTLRTSLCYPEETASFSDDECREVLEKCGLKQFVGNLDDDDITWGQKTLTG